MANAAVAQFPDSLNIAAGIITTAATAQYQPLWLVANRHGTIANQQQDASAYVLVRNTHRFARQQPADTGTYRGRFKGFYLGYGATLRNNNRLHSTFLEEGFGRVGFRTWQLRAGRYHEVTGEIDPSLASGSFGVSGNALPVPKVELAVTDYTPVPFTHGWVQFKGQFAHGWLGNGGEIKDVFLHQKSFYLRVGQRRLTFYGGLTH